MTEIEKLGEKTKIASFDLRIAGSTIKNDALDFISQLIDKNRDQILTSNNIDINNAKETGMSPAMLDRLTLSNSRIDDIIKGIKEVKSQNDPIGQVIKMDQRPNGLIVGKKRVPLGVIGIIYEARPNVTIDAACLCLKSGNTCILRGGKESINSNIALVNLIKQGLGKSGLSKDCVNLIKDTNRESAKELMHLDKYLDVLIPRGGSGLIRTVAKESSVPVIRTGEGICHIYVDDDADLQMATEILINAKCSRPSVCNAVECVLVNSNILENFLSIVVPQLEKYNVELRCDKESIRYAGKNAISANEDDWDTEYDDYILAIKTVKNINEAIMFINEHNTGHSESIITNNYIKAQMFLNKIDASAVYINASTRFTDGGEFGLGAEIGISTQKIHARGPMGIEEMTSYKYIIYGNGQVR